VITVPDADSGSDVTVKPACSSLPGEVLPSTSAAHEVKRTDSFYSLPDEMDNLAHDPVSAVAVKNEANLIPEEDHSQQPASPR
jgi:hypothetical protein